MAINKRNVSPIFIFTSASLLVEVGFRLWNQPCFTGKNLSINTTFSLNVKKNLYFLDFVKPYHYCLSTSRRIKWGKLPPL